VLDQYGFIILIVALFVPLLPGGETIVGFVLRQVAAPLLQFLVGRRVL
jgi:hypothetical protein